MLYFFIVTGQAIVSLDRE